jgi:hypothetical protein
MQTETTDIYTTDILITIYSKGLSILETAHSELGASQPVSKIAPETLRPASRFF